MSTLLGTYLWKEWRDQRCGLARLVLVLAALALCALLLPPRVAADELFVVSFVVAALAVFALSVGSDLIGGELARDRVRFLERLPGGLSAAFAGKLVFFAAAAVAIALLGLVLAQAVALARTGALADRPSQGLVHELAPLAVAVLLWTFATAAWTPRGALALPASAALITALAWPLSITRGLVPWYTLAPGELELYAALSLIGAPLSAWASFALGLRRGRGPGAALCAGTVVAALALSPAWAWTGARVFRLCTFDPGARDLEIKSAVIGEGERFLFANCSRQGAHRVEPPSFAVIVDLTDGSFKATLDAEFRGDPRWFGAEAIPIATSDGGAWLDARTAEPRSAPAALQSWTGLPPAEDLGLAPDEAVLDRKGLGYLVSGGGIHDPFLHRTFRSADLHAEGLDLGRLFVRNGSWAVCERESRRWLAYDPATRERAGIQGLLAGESVGAVAPDGRLVVAGGQGLHLLSPETGDRTPLSFDDGFAESIHPPPSPASSADPALLYVSGETWLGLARLDLERAVLLRAAGASGWVRYLGGPDALTAYVIEDARRVVRVRFGSDFREVVFPPSAP